MIENTTTLTCETKTCKKCEGTGNFVRDSKGTILRYYIGKETVFSIEICDECHGKGYIDDRKNRIAND